MAEFTFPSTPTLLPFPEARFGGLSALTYLDDRSEILAVSDDREYNRYFTIKLSTTPGSLNVQPTGVTFLQPRPEGMLIDLEGMIQAPNGMLWFSSDGVADREPRIPPQVYEYDPDGRAGRTFMPPDKFLPEPYGEQKKGVRDNLGFESLTISPDRTRLFTATENALMQDDEISSFDHGSRSRILEFRIGADLAPGPEYIYPVEPVPRPTTFTATRGDNGLAELLALSNDELWALERAFTRGAGDSAPVTNNIRLYRVLLEGADDVSKLDSLRDRPNLRPARKELLLDLTEVQGLSPALARLDNFEGLAFGPRLVDGSRTVLLVSDDNFRASQHTAFLMFRIVEPTGPTPTP